MMESFGKSTLEMQMIFLIFYLVIALIYFLLIIYGIVWKRKWKQVLINVAVFTGVFLMAAFFYIRQSLNVICGVIGIGLILYAVIQISKMCREENRMQGNAIQESLDNLPSGAGFFDEQGMPVLMNRQMDKICRYLAGRDVQSAAELREAFIHPGKETVSFDLDLHVYCFSDGSVWKISEDFITTEGGEKFWQFLASEVSELYRNKQLLEKENRKLQEMSVAMKELSKNIMALTREEETLAMKMKVHDDLGYSVLATHRILQQESEMTREVFLSQWNRVLNLLKKDNASETGQLYQILRERARAFGVELLYNGEIPDEPEVMEQMNVILLEALSNSVRHAGATKLSVNIGSEMCKWVFVITNNGRRPDKEIEEGGGLSAIRRKIENLNGTVEIRSFPEYSLIIKIPKNREEHI